MDAFQSSSIRSWITCATYAIMNNLNKPIYDPIDIENCTGVTFGLASLGSEYAFSRILTPSTFFWDGIVRLDDILGIHVKRYSFENKLDLMDYIKNDLPGPAILGPISMTSLSYLPLCTQYKFADHYISINKNGHDYILKDSEGIPGMKVSEKELSDYLSIDGIYEACGVYNIGIVTCTIKQRNHVDIARKILQYAGDNYARAEESDQGGKAFSMCSSIIVNYQESRWFNPLMYALNHVMQRKFMLLYAGRDCTLLTNDFKRHINNQILSIANLRNLLIDRRISDAVHVLQQLSISESTLYINWKKWVIL